MIRRAYTQVCKKVRMDFKPLVWIDCEMTGLDQVNDQIIEVCCIVTDGKLRNLDQESATQCYESVVHCPQEKLDKMDQWCLDHHGSSGLMAKCASSTKTMAQVESELLAYLKKYVPEPRVGMLAGNSVHMDKLFMLKDFPSVVEHLHYRIVDVSSIMEVCRRHNPSLASVVPRKEAAHTAKSDILESIAQLQWYQDHYLKNEEETKDYVNEHKDKEEVLTTKRPSEEPEPAVTKKPAL
ncbi:Oligoribonuclease, mitochondrial [Nakaseomyces bracarensis]|uniref:Oligoribonuclease, mitochondrial n=1 Tax=Nakaseomyces bracarensis TaxID=273131 RepID=A0ABR4NLL7_9SACH